MRYLLPRWFSRFSLTALVAFAIATPVNAAEQVYFKSGTLELSLSVQALNTWLETGQVDPELSGYLTLLNPQQQTQLKGLLQTQYDENYFNLSRITYTSIGERFLKNMGNVIRTRDKGNGFEDLRTAFVRASQDKKGLSLINVLQQYPNDVEIDVDLIVGIIQRTSDLITQTDALMAKFDQVASAEAQGERLPGPSQPDLRQPGALETTQQILKIKDFRYDLYRPLQAPSPSPVVVITAGFGAQHDFFEDLAHHIASHGFAVAIAQHAGSDNHRRHGFFEGKYEELFEPTEYINRPREVIAVLDDLEQRNATEFNGQFDLTKVGVFSHSFGGPTALSLGGANLNFEQLEQSCDDQMDPLNASLYYQCHALEITETEKSKLPQPRDPRIKALFLLGPFSKALFGAKELSQIDLPVFWEATNIDLPAPLALEQMPAFQTLTTPDRYLAIAKGLPHAHITFEVLTGLVKESEVKRLEALSMLYQKALTVAFFKVHVAQEEAFRSYLQASYAQSISEAPYKLHLFDAKAAQLVFK